MSPIKNPAAAASRAGLKAAGGHGNLFSELVAPDYPGPKMGLEPPRGGISVT